MKYILHTFANGTNAHRILNQNNKKTAAHVRRRQSFRILHTRFAYAVNMSERQKNFGGGSARTWRAGSMPDSVSQQPLVKRHGALQHICRGQNALRKRKGLYFKCAE